MGSFSRQQVQLWKMVKMPLQGLNDVLQMPHFTAESSYMKLRLLNKCRGDILWFWLFSFTHTSWNTFDLLKAAMQTSNTVVFGLLLNVSLLQIVLL